jgi:hypothetical protein
MEISQGNFLCSYPYHKQAKVSYFSFLSFRPRERVDTSGKGECWGNGVGNEYAAKYV